MTGPDDSTQPDQPAADAGATPGDSAAAAAAGGGTSTETAARGPKPAARTDDVADPGKGDRRRRPDLTDAALRSIIKDAARQSRSGHFRPRRDLPLKLHPALQRSREAVAAAGGVKGPTIEAGFALRKLPVAQTSRPRMRAAAVFFVLQWLAGALAGVLYAHFQPDSGEHAHFITLLLSSLATFTCAVVAYIELFKFTRAGRSVAIGLAYVNAVAYALLAFYARHWLLVVAQVLFAVAVTVFLRDPEKGNRKATAGESSSGGEPGEPVAEPAEPDSAAPRVPGRKSLVAGVGLAVAAWLVLLVPALIYRVSANRAPVEFDKARQLAGANAHQQAADAARTARGHYRLLAWMAGLIGEKNRARGEFAARLGMCTALAGDAQTGYQQVMEAYSYNHDFGPIDEVYRMKAHVYSLLHGLEWREHTERILTDDEIEQIELLNARPTNSVDEEYYRATGQTPPPPEWTPPGFHDPLSDD